MVIKKTVGLLKTKTSFFQRCPVCPPGVRSVEGAPGSGRFFCFWMGEQGPGGQGRPEALEGAVFSGGAGAGAGSSGRGSPARGPLLFITHGTKPQV